MWIKLTYLVFSNCEVIDSYEYDLKKFNLDQVVCQLYIRVSVFARACPRNVKHDNVLLFILDPLKE